MLAAVAICSVDEAVPLAGAGVGGIVLLTPSEETLVTRQQRIPYIRYRGTSNDKEHTFSQMRHAFMKRRIESSPYIPHM